MRAAVGAVVVLALVGVGAAVVSALLAPGGSTSVVGASPSAAPTDPLSPPGGGDAGVAPSEAAVIVHVLGSVREPGIVEVRLGDRVVDAIAAAGGALEDADLGGVNLARALVDGEQVYVPEVGEVVTGGGAGGAGPAAGGAAGAGVGASPGGASAALVNLNSADSAALETLPGVGPALAQRIIAWREENGPFRAVDEMLAVSGIGEKTLAGFRDQVTV